jgi:UDP-2-acetamido-2-deoxy-ribo-hexuluronate aminotransferase
MNLLLDVNVVVDVCAKRQPYYADSLGAVAFATKQGHRIWLYAGAVQTMEYTLGSELKRLRQGPIASISNKAFGLQARALLHDFSTGKNWLSALAGEGDVFEADDPEDEQYILALDRFKRGDIVLLTRDEVLLKKYPDLTMSPTSYIIQSTVQSPKSSTLEFINLKTQQDTLRPKLERNIHRVMTHGQYIMGPEIKELEAKLAEYVGVTHAITAASGTVSLEIALRALDIGPGDEVITVPFTWISTAEVIGQVGARPVFVDIEPATYNMNVDLLEAAITPRTKAIMPVSLFGQMPDYDRINAIAAKFNLPVIEDGAQSFGATQRGRRSCGVTTIGSTSFFPAKPLGCYGDGGALFTNDDQLAEKMRAIRTHGGIKRHHHPFIGMNGRFDTIQAAILLAKLDHFDWEVKRRQEIGDHYNQLIADYCPLLTPPVIEDGNTSVYAQFTIRAPNRDSLVTELKDQGIPNAVYYPKCLHEQPAFDFCNYQWGDFPESEKASREVLSLPMHPYLAEKDQEKVVKILQSIL